MASKTITVCDFDEHDEDDDVRAVEHRTFHADGASYEVDVCTECDGKFTDFQELTRRWVAAARPAAAPPKPSRSRSGSQSTSNGAEPRTDRGENAAIRDYARRQGIAISDRGRISEELRQQYRQWAAQNASQRWDAAAGGNDRPEPRAAPSPPAQQSPPQPAAPLGAPAGLRTGVSPYPSSGAPRG